MGRETRFKTWIRRQFDHRLDSPTSRRRSRFYEKWLDLGVLRIWWTNEALVAADVIRANNPTERRFEGYAARGVKTVLNLRNDVDQAPVKLAKETCQKLGLEFVSFPMAPRRAPTRQELLDLIALFSCLQRPILMHCKSGADRTGLAAAIWRMTQEGEPLEAARSELSLKHLHRPDSETGVLDEVLLQYEHDAHRTDFAKWVRLEYDAEKVKIAARDKRPQRGKFKELVAILHDLHRYAQHREARWHRSFDGAPTTDEQKRRAQFFIRWVDHGILRTIWTNRAEVRPGLVRSNHPTEVRLVQEAKNGLRTVVNLRGSSEQPQYLLERELCLELGLKLVDIPLNATRAPTAEALLCLLETLQTAERPALIHCKSGADRTGLAASLFILDQGGSFEEAKRQLSWRFLHFRQGRKGVLDAIVAAYEAARIANDVSLRNWLCNDYDPDTITNAWRGKRK